MADDTGTVVEQPTAKVIGFWQCWAFTVGTMIGTGIFMMPALLAPYGGLSFGGWLITAGGSIAIALAIGRLASRTTRSGGMQIYVQDAFGRLPGFLVGWSNWVACVISTAALAVGFVGYLTAIVPGLSTEPGYQAAVAVAVIWTVTLGLVRGVKEAGFVQLLLTVLKLIPLALVIIWGFVAGKTENLPPVNPSGDEPLAILSATALLTMFAFIGLDVGAMPAGNVKDPTRTLPRAVVTGTITAAVVYILATAAVMLLIPAGQLGSSTSPFADAVRGIGEWAPPLITVGALVSIAGSLNGNIFCTAQQSMAAGLEGIAPKILAKLNKGEAPWVSLIFSSALASALLLLNYSRGLVGAFTFLIMMTTVACLVAYLVCALAELKHSWRNARAWAAVAVIAALYAAFAIFGAGQESLIWGFVLIALGVPVYYLGRQPAVIAASAPA
ncbi:MAG: amino acid permease [Hyphomonadaceae bacterium]|nr:amino acid permease [Hyphomonadaceae bacterium]